MNITLQDVTKVYKSPNNSEVVALNRVSFSIQDSKFVSIVGPSGCGKSTLLYIVSGLEPPSTGAIQFEGTKRSKGPLTAIVWQDYALLPWRSVLTNVSYGLELRGISKRERSEIANKFIELVGIRGFEHHFPHQLSGGMKQRVGIARALASDPEFLLMDEPFAAVDAQTRVFLQQELLRIWDKTRKAVLFVTHSIDEAILLSDYIAIMSRRPGTIKEFLQVNLPRPRTVDIESTNEFIDLRSHVWDSMKEEYVAERS